MTKRSQDGFPLAVIAVEHLRVTFEIYNLRLGQAAGEELGRGMTSEIVSPAWACSAIPEDAK